MTFSSRNGFSSICVLCVLCVRLFGAGPNPTQWSDKKLTVERFLHGEAASGFSGSVLVAENRKIFFDKVYGRVDRHRPVFWFASLSKPITACAVLKLQEEQRLSIHDPITKFFSGVPLDKQKITIHQLLTHTSGLPLEYAADGIAERKEAVSAILSLPLKYAPGEKWNYSGDGFVLLAAIIEIASGESFEGYVRSRIFRPAGMRNAGFWGDGGSTGVSPVPDPTKLKTLKQTVIKDGRSVPNWGWRGSTGIYGTSRDLYAFLLSLESGKLLSQESRSQMWSTYWEFRRDGNVVTGNGYGWIVDIQNDKWQAVRHMGDELELGHNGIVSLTNTGQMVVVLSNSGNVDDDAWSTRVFVGVRKILKDPK